MNALPIAILDIIVIGIVILSGLLAAVRGFTREVLAIASWVAAAAAAYAFHPVVLPYVKPYITNDNLALAASIGAVFIGVLIIVSLFTVKISDLILDSKIGALDRSLGFIFGAVRGFLIAVIAFMFFDTLVGEKQQPEWVKQAKTRPFLKEAGDQLLALLPKDLDALKKAAPAIPGLQLPGNGQTAPAPAPAPTAAPTPAAPAPAPVTPNQAPPNNQKRTDQQGLQNLINSTATPAANTAPAANPAAAPGSAQQNQPKR
ncbi:CvpA family protein [Rhizobiales bacterium TNE-4]|nr:CvpA family protein [Rhizobiales bacterium TNE-4]MBV1827292.1 CvpA family protein [Rhizobiales bacterium TNE-4]